MDTGDGTLPVIMLDGFDELIQAAHASRYDYLEQIQEFQLGQSGADGPSP